jgi:flavorubredoxin
VTGDQVRSIVLALRKVADLPYTMVATGHGPILRYNLQEPVNR